MGRNGRGPNMNPSSTLPKTLMAQKDGMGFNLFNLFGFSHGYA